MDRCRHFDYNKKSQDNIVLKRPFEFGCFWNIGWGFGRRVGFLGRIINLNKLQKIVNGQTGKALVEETDVNIRQYAKYLFKEGSVSDKRELLANLRSRLNYKDKTITLIEE